VLSSAGSKVGYAGYVQDAYVPTVSHVRYRVLKVDLGRWLQRDPAGYVDGANLYEYVRSSPAGMRDWSGLVGQACTDSPWESTIEVELVFDRDATVNALLGPSVVSHIGSSGSCSVGQTQFRTVGWWRCRKCVATTPLFHFVLSCGDGCLHCNDYCTYCRGIGEYRCTGRLFREPYWKLIYYWPIEECTAPDCGDPTCCRDEGHYDVW